MKQTNQFFNLKNEKESYYYDVEDDIKLADENNCWLIVTIGGRDTGKTYSSLNYMIEYHLDFAFIKRTNKDVNTLCKRKKNVANFNPFKALNRDKGWNIKPFPLMDGIGCFYDEADDPDVDDENPPLPIGVIYSLNAISDIRGFDNSEAEYVIFDEFIPPVYAKIDSKEGDKFLDLYATLNRDREHRGKKPLRAILLANANRAYNPIIEVMELTDVITYMKSKGYSYYINNGILIHLLDDNPKYKERESKTAIMQSLAHTDWGHMALDNDFAYDDFSCVGQTSIKGYQCKVGFKHKSNYYFVWYKNNKYYVCKSKNPNVKIYDLDKETECNKFWLDYGIDLRCSTIENNVMFEKFSGYNIIMNFKKLFL